MKTQISLAELKGLLESGIKVLLIDVRSEEEYLNKHIPNAIHLPLERIRSNDYVLQDHTCLITLCGKGGGRSEAAADIFRSRLSTEVYFLEGGTTAWFS